MKKICLLAFSFLIFLLSFNSFSAKTEAATENSSATPSLQQEVNYELPYPGILPDSPLYFLRVVRDKIVGFLVSDPLKKAEFNLLQADKRLNAGIYLLNSPKQDEKKVKLALSTISKAENYFEESLDQIKKAKMEGRNVDEMEGKLRNALRKHKQELTYIIQKISADFKTGFEKERKRVANFEERLSR